MPAVASTPSISGICTSISTASNRSAASHRLAPFSDAPPPCPPLFQHADRHPLVHRIVLGQQDVELAARAYGRRAQDGSHFDRRFRRGRP